MNPQTFLFSFLQYLAYLLGALIYILDVIEKYQKMAETSPDASITYNKKSFWKKEKFNIIRIIALGIVSIIVLPWIIGGQTFAVMKDDGTVLYSLPIKSALIPLQIVVGYTGGRGILAALGKSKKDLYKRIGIDEPKE